ncbi:DNA methyltransferase [Aquipuribacter sp. MA13-6]|uniref:DNA methyltransferase n=1 Tax=unclassified Aquipuribacter TaxID=2635084 RepID=UPI003EEC270F
MSNLFKPNDVSERHLSSKGIRLTITRGRRLSLNEMRDRVARFAVDYKDVRRERQNTGDFWRAFMRCYGVEDSYLQGVTFEYPARRSDTGGRGFIDVFLPGKYLIEQKSEGRIKRPKGSEQSNAEQQAAAYLTGGDIAPAQMPRWVITSDFVTVQVTDLSVSRRSPTRTKTVRTEDLVDHVELFLFLTGEDSEALIAEEQADASVAAARIMGNLYSAMTHDADTDSSEIEDAGQEDAATMQASVLLTRLLFLMFGDDAGLWERGLFERFIRTRTSADGSDLGPQLAALFDVLDTPKPRDKRMDEAFQEFPHINGALFARGGTQTMWFDSTMRDALLEACNFDWARISPAVFGSLFQTIKSKAARRESGEHYTSEANILKVLRPMFLDDMRKRLDAAHTKPALQELHDEFRQYRYVDPACGCGNFLIVAYREMRALELELLVKLQAKRGRDEELLLDPSDLLHVRLDQFFGIELYWWPAKIAETAMFLVDHQANQRMAKVLGYTPNRLPITISATIVHVNALTVDWNVLLPNDGAKVLIFGNPPFVGTKERTAAQTQELKAVWGADKYSGFLDFVTAWLAKSVDYLDGRTGDFAFVTTNSITQGMQPANLFPVFKAAGWRIAFAHRTFVWTSEAASSEKASVHCVIVGFSRQVQAKGILYDYPDQRGPGELVKLATGINGYLVDASDVSVEARRHPLSPELPEVNVGSKAVDWGFLTIDETEFAEVSADPILRKYLRRYVGGKELINGLQRWCLWLVDLEPSDLAKSHALRERIAKVKALRSSSKKEATRVLADTPHLFGERYQPLGPYLGIPQTFSENRQFATVERLEGQVIASMKLFTCPDPDGFAYAIFGTSMFITWQKTVGGRLKSDPSFSNTLVWNTLPIPVLGGSLRRRIITAGKAVNLARSLFPDRTLAEHYNPLGMKPELVKAHRDLDKLVDRALGVTSRRPTELERQKALFASYERLNMVQ